MMLFACHRRPDRSFFWKGRPFPVCARCTGLYTGYLLGLVLLLLFGIMPLTAAILLVVPLAVDSLTQYWQWRVSTNSFRLVTGILAGIGIIYGTAQFAVIAGLYLTGSSPEGSY